MLFKSTLKLLFLKKKSKYKKKSKWTKRLKMKRRKLRDQFFFFQVTWSPSLLIDQAIKNNKFTHYRYVIIPHIKRGREKK